MAKHLVGPLLASSHHLFNSQIQHYHILPSGPFYDFPLCSEQSLSFPSRPPGNHCSTMPGGGGATPTSPLPMPVSSLQIPHCGSSCRTPLGFRWLDLGWALLQGRQPKASGTYSTRGSRKGGILTSTSREDMKLGGGTHSRPEGWLDLGSARGSPAVSSSQGSHQHHPQWQREGPCQATKTHIPCLLCTLVSPTHSSPLVSHGVC